MAWTPSDLLQTLQFLGRHRGDNTTIEVKRAAGGVPQNLPETLCAFANMPDGGIIILGVDENSDFSINGVEDPARVEAMVVQQARSTVKPSPYLETATVEIDRVPVVVVHVSGLSPSQKPALHRGRAYLRQADGDYVMGPADLHMIEVARLHATEAQQYDALTVPGTSKDDLDAALLEEYLRNARANSSRLARYDDNDVLHQTGVLDRSGDLTQAGLYALGQYPQGRLPALGVTAAVRFPADRVPSQARTRNLQHFDGPLPTLLEDLMIWVRRNLTTEQIYGRDGHMRNELELPQRAVREALANALVHRDLGPDTLGQGKQVEVRIDPERLLIQSPGGLRGITLRQLESEELAKAAVNQRLYTIAKNLRTPDGARIIEGEGGGVREILLSTRDADLQRPKLIDTGVQFKAILWRGSAFSTDDRTWLRDLPGHPSLTHVQKSIMVSLRAGQAWSVDRIKHEFSPLSTDEALVELRGLQQAGLVSVDLDDDPQIALRHTVDANNSRATAVDTPSTAGELHRREESPEGNSRPTVDVRKIPGKNGPAVYSALTEGTFTLTELTERTALSRRQVSYALDQLTEQGLVTMAGGQGHRNTTYSLAPMAQQKANSS